MDTQHVAELYLSLCHDEALVEANALKKALVQTGRSVFLSLEPPGPETLDDVALNLDGAKLIIIMGSKSLVLCIALYSLSCSSLMSLHTK